MLFTGRGTLKYYPDRPCVRFCTFIHALLPWLLFRYLWVMKFWPHLCNENSIRMNKDNDYCCCEIMVPLVHVTEIEMYACSERTVFHEVDG